jgi:hypothetical protein
MGIMKRRLFGLTSGITLVFVAVLLNSCTMVPVVIDPKYRGMIGRPGGSERVIDQVMVEGVDDKEYVRQPPSNGPMGAMYQVLESKKGPERHKHEVMLDELLNGAKELYPSETVSIKNATNRYSCSISSRTTNFDYYRCRVFHVADIVVAEPMPEPVTYSVELSLADVSRADLYRRIANWLADKKYVEDGTVAGVRLETDLASGVDLGRIKGDYIFYLTSGQKIYVITSSFTIDVHDDKAEMSFKNTRLQRERGGDEEQIFLQSIANAAQAELVSFSDKLRGSVTR